MKHAKLMVTGCLGQLGGELVAALRGEYEVCGADRQQFDITDRSAVNTAIVSARPTAVLHTAAYTDVDGCETNRELAMTVNADGTENIARACREVGAKMIYFSTDYVFDGSKQDAYVESDPPNPQTVYGRSKLEGEQAVVSLLDNYTVVRIAWLYSARGVNFVRKMTQQGSQWLKQAAEERRPLMVVNDQVANPTWTAEVARQTQVILDNDLTGILHATSGGEVSWYHFTVRLFELLDLRVPVHPCSSDEFHRPATRPKRSSLDNNRLGESGLDIMRHWDAALSEFVGREGKGLIL
ncbi:MAG: dTDP-4-dehydrorhamnose reductase [candidate division Zixibacteria bacterium]|nr:dTDP-4-dehydrorhamnose reductase [candidate division Zixibacteria bacterium]